MSNVNKLAAEMAAIMGVEAPAYPDEEDQIQEDRGDEAVMAYTLHPELFTKLKCANEDCGKTFAVSRANVSTCSRKCRHARMRAMGLGAAIGKSNPNGPKDIKYVDRVWWGREPLTVSPEALSVADELLASRDSGLEAREGVTETVQEAPDPGAGILDGLSDLFT